MRGPFKNTGVMPEGDVVKVKFRDDGFEHNCIGDMDFCWRLADEVYPIELYWLADEGEV